MKRMQSIGVSAVLAATLLVGCGEDPTIVDPPASQRCQSPAEYLAFDAANHAPQDLRQTKIDEIVALFDQAAADISKASANAATALNIYKDPGANLQAKVQGRLDMRYSPPRAVGAEIDKSITDAIEKMRTATDPHDVRVAKQYIEKAGFQRFLYLSVMEELLKEPSKKHYDEAYGYMGSGQTNAEAGRKGLARLATRRDANNGTTLAAELFALVLDGSCAIETALTSLNKETMAANENAQYAQLTQQLDTKLQLVFAYSVGHEFIDYIKAGTDAKTAHIKLAEADGFLKTLEPSMIAAGGAKASLVTELRAAIDATLAAAKPDSTTWISTFKAQEFLDKLEAAFAIDVKA